VLRVDEGQARGVAFVTLREGIGTSTPAGRLVAGVRASIGEFERARIQERIYTGWRAHARRVSGWGGGARRLPGAVNHLCGCLTRPWRRNSA
jgi:DNA invertase Pin-like site-specific DNA recombinase